MGTKGRSLAEELSAIQVKRLAKPGLHFVGHVVGLAIQVTPAGTKSWILRYTAGTRRREMGLGNYPSVTLAKACEIARDARDLLRQGIDPIEDARAKRSQLDAVLSISFDQAADKYIASHEAGWKNPKHSQQWRNTIEAYASPHFGKLQVRDVATTHVMQALDPIWSTKTETATRLRGRIEAVLDWAKVRGYRDGENPARWRGHLDKLLAKPSKVARAGHHAALPYAQMGDFMPKLRAAVGMGARALEFAILTAARSGEVRGATWAEIDIEAGTWTIPGARMKAGRDHRVPLSEAALELLAKLPRLDGVDLVFFGSKNKPLSDMSLTAVLRRMSLDVTAHGFRSTFRDWAAETTAYPSEMVEMALAHTISNKVEAAYRRGDLFEKRRRLMIDWSRFCDTSPAPAGTVHPIRGAA